MKQHIVALVAIAILALTLVQPVDATTTWMTYREDIAIDAITVDINIESMNVTGNDISTNVSLPCILSELDNTSTITHINASSNCTFSMTVNGGTINTSTPLNATVGWWANISLATVLATGNVTATDTYLNVSITVNDTNVVTAQGNIVASDANCTSTFVTNCQTVKEKDVVKPTVGTSSSTSFMTVNNSINISHTQGYNLSDFNASLSYPSHAISSASYYNFGVVQNNTPEEIYKNYQKYGPYVYKYDEDVDGNEHEVTIYVKSNELLTLTVDYSLSASDDVYEGIFDTLNYDTLEVELNGADVDWEQGSIEFEDLTIKEGWSVNEFTLTWTEPTIPTAVEQEWWKQTFLGLQIYIWLLIALIAVIVVLLVYISTKN